MGKFFSFGDAKAYSNDTLKVSEILDVNLFKLDNGEVVRLIGIIPPRVPHRDAFVFLKDVVLGKEVVLEYDKSRKDENKNSLVFVYINVGKNFDTTKNIEILRKYKRHLRYFEAADESGETPDNFWVIDSHGNKGINPEVVKTMKPKGDLYLQINLALVSCGFVDFKSMPPDTCMDSLFRIEYKGALEEKRGIWGEDPNFKM